MRKNSRISAKSSSKKSPDPSNDVTEVKPVTKPAVRPLLADLREMILQAREGVARAVDSGLVTLYWHVGRRIRQDILNEKRAQYGERIVSALGRQLEREFGRGFGEKNLRRMSQFAEVFQTAKIVVTLSRQFNRELGWDFGIPTKALKLISSKFFAPRRRSTILYESIVAVNFTTRLIIEWNILMIRTYTAKYMAIPSGYMGQLSEWPEVITEGSDLEDCSESLRDALEQMLLAYREQKKEIPIGSVGK